MTAASTAPIRIGDLVLLHAGSVRGLHLVLDVAADALAVTSANDLRIEGGSFRVEKADVIASWSASSAAGMNRLPVREHAIDLTPRRAAVAEVAEPPEAPDNPEFIITLPASRAAVEVERHLPNGRRGPSRTIHYDAVDGRILVDRRDVNKILAGVDGAKFGPGQSTTGFEIPAFAGGF